MNRSLALRIGVLQRRLPRAWGLMSPEWRDAVARLHAGGLSEDDLETRVFELEQAYIAALEVQLKREDRLASVAIKTSGSLCGLSRQLGKTVKEVAGRQRKGVGVANSNRTKEAQARWAPRVAKYLDLVEGGIKPSAARNAIAAEAEKEDGKRPSQNTLSRYLGKKSPSQL